jgi:hypothetical protein
MKVWNILIQFHTEYNTYDTNMLVCHDTKKGAISIAEEKFKEIYKLDTAKYYDVDSFNLEDLKPGFIRII